MFLLLFCKNTYHLAVSPFFLNGKIAPIFVTAEWLFYINLYKQMFFKVLWVVGKNGEEISCLLTRILKLSEVDQCSLFNNEVLSGSEG